VALRPHSLVTIDGVQGYLFLMLPVVNYYSLLFVISRETVIALLPVEYSFFTVIGGIALHIVMMYWQCLSSSAAQVFSIDSAWVLVLRRCLILAVPEF